MDVNTHRIYSDKFSLYVLDLSQIDLATGEDCFWQVNEWAKLFKATTWEEIKMIADKNEYLTETSNTLCDLYADRNVRERCLDRIEYNLRMKRYEDAIKEKDATIKELVAENAKALEEKDALIRKLMEEKDKTIEEQDKTIEEKERTIKEQSIALDEKDALVKKLMEEITEPKQQK